MSRKYISELDGIRAIAALMVLFGHFFAHASFTQHTIGDFLHKIFSLGQVGVTIFFVLSGYLITRILIETKENKGYFGKFYMRRFLRIFPLYYFFLIIVYFLIPTINSGDYVSFKSQIWYWLYVQNISDTFKLGAQGPSHFWSLAIEEQFYLLWPLLIFVVPRASLGKLALFTILIGNVMRILLLIRGVEVYYFTITRMDELALGALLVHLELKRPHFLNRRIMWRGLLIMSSLVIIIRFVNPGIGILWVQMIKYPLISVSAFFLIGWVISPGKDSFTFTLLNSKFATYSGKISYGLYVYHPLCFAIINSNFTPDFIVMKFLMAFSLTYLVAGLSFRYLELPFLRLKRNFSYSKNQSPMLSSESPEKKLSAVKIPE